MKKFNGESWVTVGEAGFIPDEYPLTDIAIDSNDTIYVVCDGTLDYIDYNDTDFNIESTPVLKFDGDRWVTVGELGLSAEMANSPKIAIDSNDTPYVLFKDKSANYSLTVKKLDGNNWVTVGKAGFPEDRLYESKIAIDSNDTPYVIYGAQSKQRIVKKFNGESWVTVGEAGLAELEYGTLEDISFDSNNTPYVTNGVTIRSSSDSFSYVLKFDGKNWMLIGKEDFTSVSEFFSTNIDIDSSDTLYAVYAEDTSRKIYVNKLINGRWSTDLDDDGDEDLIEDSSDIISWGTGNEPDIVIDSSSTPYVIYEDNSPKYAVVVLKFD